MNNENSTNEEHQITEEANKKRTQALIVAMVLLGGALLMATLYGVEVKQVNNALAEENATLTAEAEEDAASYPDIYNYLDSVTVDSFYSMIEDKEDFAVYVGRPSCSDCQTFEPGFIEFLEENPSLQEEILYVNVSEVKEDEEAWAEFIEKSGGIQYTPTVALYEDGVLVDKVEWTPEKGITNEEVEVWITETLMTE